MGECRVENAECRVKRVCVKTAFLAALLAAMAGCSREAEVSPAAPEGYMKDKAFRAKLDGQVEKRGELAAARNGIVAQMTEMSEAKKRELGTDDEAKLKARYGGQLDIYRRAISEVFGRRCREVYIYSFYTGKLISFEA